MAANLHAEPDGDLLQAHLTGDPQAFTALYTRYRVPIYAYLLRRCGRTHADSSFRTAWRAAALGDGLDVRKDFVAQLFGLAHAEVKRVAPDGPSTPDTTLPELTQRTRHRAQRFERSLRQVPIEVRDAYLLYEEGGLTLSEVGDILGLEAEEVRERVRLALTELRSALDTATIDTTALHDPQVAVAHLAARRTPPPTLDAVVLDEVRRAAEINAERRRQTRERLRFWPYALLVVGGLVLAQSAVYWTGREPVPAAVLEAPPPPVVVEPVRFVPEPPKPAPAPAPRKKAKARVVAPPPVVAPKPIVPTTITPAPIAAAAPATVPAEPAPTEPAPTEPATDDTVPAPPTAVDPLIDAPPPPGSR